MSVSSPGPLSRSAKKARQSSLPPLSPCRSPTSTGFVPPKSPTSSVPNINIEYNVPNSYPKSPTSKSPLGIYGQRMQQTKTSTTSSGHGGYYGSQNNVQTPKSPKSFGPQITSSYQDQRARHYQKSSTESMTPKSPVPRSPTSYCSQKSPKSPRQIMFSNDVKSPKSPKYFGDSLKSPQPSQQNIFNFNIITSPVSPGNSSKSIAEHHAGAKKTFSQDEYFDRQQKKRENKKGLTKTVSEPKNSKYEQISIKFDHHMDSSPEKNDPTDFDTKPGGGGRNENVPTKSKNKSKKCNIRTNPCYQAHYGSSKSINEQHSESFEKDYESSTTRTPIQRCRKSTSDLTDLTDDAVNTTLTSLSRPSSPRRRGSMKGGLAYLASRRGSRDSNCSNMSNFSNEDIGPLNFQNTARGRQRRTSNFLELPVPDHVRPRVCSLPEKAYNPRLSDDLYRLRTFSITNKGSVVNCGDSIINRRSRSNTSVNSTASRQSAVSGGNSPFDGASSCCSAYHAVDSSSPGSDTTPACEEIPRYRVVLLGDAGVGKTALVSQFMTSEYMNTYDASLDDEFGEKTVSILLDGEESEMIFIDHPSIEMSVENSLSTYEPHACVVVYSITSKESFKVAEETLNYLWRENYTQEKSVIVVGNKADLARSRVISANDGKSLAVSRDCKFIETSSGIQHNVDELLVGILKQIRLRECRDKKNAATNGKKERKLHGSKTSLSLNIAREILQKMCLNDISKSKSCENLHVL